MGQPLGDPHVVLVQRVAGGVRVRGPVGTTVAEHRDHVVPDRVGVERVGHRARAGRARLRHHRVHHLRRHQHRHGGPLGLVALEVGVEAVVHQVTEQVSKLLDVLDAVGALPLDGLPLLGGDVAPSRKPRPVGLDELDPPVGVGLAGVETDRGFDAHGGLPVCHGLGRAGWWLRRAGCVGRESSVRVRGEPPVRPMTRRRISCLKTNARRIHRSWLGKRVIRPACTGCWTGPWSCPRRPPASTPGASCGQTRSGSASRSSTWTPRPSASSSARTAVTGTPCAPRSSTS